MSTLGAPSPISNHLAHTHAYAPPPIHNPSIYDSYMNPPPPVQYTYTQPHHGTKRSAPDDEVESSTNISTHFKKLRLNQTHLPHPTTLSPVGVSLRSSNYVASQTPPDAQHTQDPTLYANEVSMHHDGGFSGDQTTVQPSLASDFMPLDDTPNKIYIHDLDSEIAAIEAAEPERSTFLLPDFDKNVSRIPFNILKQKFDAMPGSSRARDDSQALVLYRDPISISVPPEEDVIRKAIIAARKVAREKMKRDYEEQYRSQGHDGNGDEIGVAGGVTGLLHTIREVPSHDDEVITMDGNISDPDAMEIE